MDTNPVITITDKLGRDAISKRLGVTLHSIRHARTSKRFPASWYAPLLDLCNAAGIDCPLDAFNWQDDKKPRAAAERAAS